MQSFVPKKEEHEDHEREEDSEQEEPPSRRYSDKLSVGQYEPPKLEPHSDIEPSVREI